jgi:CubicO group peptidase (beta-lactamase class C family)
VKVLRNTAIVLIALYLALFGLTKAIRYPEPIASIRLGLAPASQTPDLMPSHWIVAAPSTFAPWKAVAAEQIGGVTFDGQPLELQEFLDTTNTNALLVIRDGKISYEYYKEDKFKNSRLPSYSVGKAMTALVVGQLIDQGKITESDTFVSYFPEYKTGGSFDKVTVQQLLDMQSGVGVSDNYPSGPSGWGVAIAQMYASTDIPWFIGNNRKMDFEPGTESVYRSVDTQMIGMIIQKVTNQSVSDYFTANIWQRVGADFDATWNVDKVGGYEKTFCCFNAVARDYARIGQLILDDGVVPFDKQQVISSSWKIGRASCRERVLEAV